jgi:hypothetical protein
LENIDGVKWFRIYIGKFAGEKEARRTGSELKAKGLSSYFKPIPFDKIIPPSKVVATKPSKQSSPPGKFEESTPPDPTESQLIQKPQLDQKKSEKTVDKKISPLVINDITFSVKKGERELVLLHANRYFSPSVRFNLKEEKPTIFIDIEPPVTVQNVEAEISVNGKWIKQIDTRSDHNSKTIRIVVYLHATENYKVSQSFYKAEKIFAVKISAKKNTREK